MQRTLRTVAVIIVLAGAARAQDPSSSLSPFNVFFQWSENDDALFVGVLLAPTALATIASGVTSPLACEFPKDGFSILYCIDSGDKFLAYATSGGAATVINAGLTDPGENMIWRDMATDPTTGTVYALAQGEGPNTGFGSLWTVSLATGINSFVGFTAALHAMAFDLSGQLYGLDGNAQDIYSIDKTTGNSALIGPTGNVDFSSTGSMDLDEDDGTIYASDLSRLWTVNPLTGAFNLVGILGLDHVTSVVRGPFAIAAPSSLPVELVEFRVTVVAGVLQVSWSTASETDNAAFEVEISTDGEEFEVRGSVEGAGTTTEPQMYTMDVDPVNAGRNFLRLKQIDFDGSFTYSPVIEVAVSIPDGIVLDPAYPNPFSSSTALRFAVARDMPATLEVFDAVGRRVAVLYDGLAPAGTVQQVTFAAADLPGGLYLYRIVTPAGVRTGKVVLLK